MRIVGFPFAALGYGFVYLDPVFRELFSHQDETLLRPLAMPFVKYRSLIAWNPDLFPRIQYVMFIAKTPGPPASAWVAMLVPLS
jgi:hypothetical protein